MKRAVIAVLTGILTSSTPPLQSATLTGAAVQETPEDQLARGSACVVTLAQTTLNSITEVTAREGADVRVLEKYAVEGQEPELYTLELLRNLYSDDVVASLISRLNEHAADGLAAREATADDYNGLLVPPIRAIVIPRSLLVNCQTYG